MLLTLTQLVGELLFEELEKQLEVVEVMDSGDEGGVMFMLVGWAPAVRGESASGNCKLLKADGLTAAPGRTLPSAATGLSLATSLRAAAEAMAEAPSAPLAITFEGLDPWMVVDVLFRLFPLKLPGSWWLAFGLLEGGIGARTGKELVSC